MRVLLALLVATLFLAGCKTASPTATTGLASTPAITPTPTPLPTPTIAETFAAAQTNTPLPSPVPTPTPPQVHALSPTLVVTPPPFSTATPSIRPVSRVAVAIECIYYDGQVPRSEADEYVQIVNAGDTVVNLQGWRIADVADGSPSFIFPAFSLNPGGRTRVYTNQDHPEWGGFFFGYGRAVWNNSEPDVAVLYNPEGLEVSRQSYPPPCRG